MAAAVQPAGLAAAAAAPPPPPETPEMLLAKANQLIRAFRAEASINAQQKAVLQRQVDSLTQAHAAVKADLDAAKARIVALEKENKDLLDELKVAVGGFRSLRADMLRTNEMLGKRCKQLTGLPDPDSFFAFCNLLDADGHLSAVNVKAAPGWEEPSDDVEPASRLRAAGAGRPRALDGVDAVFMTLMLLRTGVDTIDLHALFGIEYQTACRYFVVYTFFLKEMLEVEFPMPTGEQIYAATPHTTKDAFPNRMLQRYGDAHEQVRFHSSKRFANSTCGRFLC